MSEVIYNSKYLNDNNMRDYNIFAEEYFCGTDIKLTANNTVVKQISMIQYELQEQLKPIYGYGSYIYDDIAVGSRIITGTFICPMKNLAENEDFKCINPTTNFCPKNENTNSKSLDISTMSISDEPIYLSSKLKNQVNTISDDEVIVTNILEDSLYIYSPLNNVYGYIKK